MNVTNSTFTAGLTKVKRSSHVFSWVLENFETYYLKLQRSEDSDKISSPTFEALHPDGTSLTSWIIDLTSAVDGQSLTTFLRMASCPKKYLENKGLPCTFFIHFGTETNPKAFGRDAFHNFTESEDDWGWASFITMPKLRSERLLAGDSLRIQIDLTIFGQPESSITSKHCGIETHALKSSPNFDFLLGGSELSDIKVQCGSETFPVHKAILAGQSAVFKAMLTSEMAEVNTGVVNVTDMTPTAFRTILHYMYTGKVDHEFDSDSFLEIIYGAEKYGLNQLKNYCFQRLVDCLTRETVGALAVAAHFYGAEDRVKMTLRNFMEPIFFELVKKEEFRKLVEKHNAAFF